MFTSRVLFEKCLLHCFWIHLCSVSHRTHDMLEFPLAHNWLCQVPKVNVSCVIEVNLYTIQRSRNCVLSQTVCLCSCPSALYSP